MKSLVFAVIMTAGCAFASCTDPTGKLNYSVGSLTVGNATGISGCLTAGASASANTGSLFVVTPSSYLSPTSPLTVNWKVTEPTAGVYDYTYTFGGLSSSAAISHLEFGIGNLCTTSNLFTSSPACVYNLEVNGSASLSGNETKASALMAGSNQPANPNIPWTSETLQIYPTTGSAATSSFSVSYDSNEAPVWQNIYVRDGTTNSNEAYNTGAIGTGEFLADPGTALPEPGFYGLLALGMIGLFGVRRISRKRSLTI